MNNAFISLKKSFPFCLIISVLMFANLFILLSNHFNIITHRHTHTHKHTLCLYAHTHSFTDTLTRIRIRVHIRFYVEVAVV